MASNNEPMILVWKYINDICANMVRCGCGNGTKHTCKRGVEINLCIEKLNSKGFTYEWFCKQKLEESKQFERSGRI